jgi:hypothetical protein
MQTSEYSLTEHRGVDFAVVILREIKRADGQAAACEVATDMLVAAASILRQERGLECALHALELAGEALAVDV